MKNNKIKINQHKPLIYTRHRDIYLTITYFLLHRFRFRFKKQKFKTTINRIFVLRNFIKIRLTRYKFVSCYDKSNFMLLNIFSCFYFLRHISIFGLFLYDVYVDHGTP